MLSEILLEITKSMLKGESLDRQEILAKGYEELREIFGEEVADLMLDRVGGLFDERHGANNCINIDSHGRDVLDCNPMEYCPNKKSIVVLSERGEIERDGLDKLAILENGANDNGSYQENKGRSDERALRTDETRNIIDKDAERERIVREYELRDPKKSKLSQSGVQGDPELDA